MAAVLGVFGCSGEVTGLGGPGEPDGAAGEPSLAFTAPTDGATFVRDQLDELGGLVADVGVEVTAAGPVARTEIYAGDALLGDGPALTAELAADGAVTLRAIGYDGDGAKLAEAEVTVAVAAPQPADCYGWLDLYQLDYTLGPDRQGVEQPVTVTPPINGLPYRYVSNEQPRDTFFMHCELARSLAKAAPHLRARDVVEVVDIGVYNYRCIGGGEPPDCPNGISQHAYAKAIDIAGFVTSDATYYSVNDDWVVDDEPTCSAPTESDADAFLHEVICALKDDGVWNIVLTPNYNDAHRNHFHVDLTAGSDFIRYETDPALACGGAASLSPAVAGE